MKTDYRERSFTNKNKPRRQPLGIYAAGIAVVVLLVFASGFAGGWFTCFYKMKKTAAVQQPTVMPATSSPKTGQELKIPGSPGIQQPPPLTFYDTLQKEGKGAIGSGINANLQELSGAPAAKPSPQPQQASVPVKPSPAAAPAEKSPTPAVSEKPAPAKQPLSTAPIVVKPPAPVNPQKPATTQPDGERRFTVQVASVKDKAEADSLRDKLAANGFNPMIIEVKIPEKGVVFRVRAGRHLLLREAQALATKLGSGAIATPE